MISPRAFHRWRDLLFSTEQHCGALRKGNCYCVLGVACLAYEQDTGQTLEWTAEGAIRLNDCSYVFTLPPVVSEWLGIGDDHTISLRVSDLFTSPLLANYVKSNPLARSVFEITDSEFISITALNDHFCVPFPVLADFINVWLTVHNQPLTSDTF